MKSLCLQYGNLTIRNLRFSDLKSLKEIRDSSLEFLDTHQSFTYDETCEWFENNKPRWYAIDVRNELAGYIRTSDYSEHNKSFYVGLDLHPNFRGYGYAFQSYQMFLEAMKIDGYLSAYLKVQISNYRAYCLYRKIGFQPIGIIPDAVIKEGKSVDSVLMYKKL